ncbi:MAG: ATP phosphoribosyltransferase regulatory subunit [Gammaproteobacteria bacterium]|nr:ATP phosphoribosyltransferase regulatory subunit [Gammaproteobacteria bacterium]
MNNERWVLPEGIEELLPQDAYRVELLRRQLLDMFSAWGYELVIPPFLEYTDSLLTGMGSDLDLQTFKLVDQKSGRMMGIRADMTPQVARIDAHQLGREQPTRLCYMGTVLRTHADDLSNKRSLMQIGAELYGHDGVASDIEIIRLMLAMLQRIGLGDIYLDLGHVDIFRSLAHQAKLDRQQENLLFDALQRKAAPEINDILKQSGISAVSQSMLSELIWLNGGVDVLNKARKTLKAADSNVKKAIDNLEFIAAQLAKHDPLIELHFDLAELRGYNYHTGVVFAAYKPGAGQSIAQGGRYDHIGEVFGRARPATGFTADLRALMEYSSNPGAVEPGIFAPCTDDEAQTKTIDELRAQGNRVIAALPGQTGDAKSMGCDRRLEKQNDKWVVVKA